MANEKELRESYQGHEIVMRTTRRGPKLVVDGAEVDLDKLDDEGNAWWSPASYSWFSSPVEVARNIVNIQEILGGKKAEVPSFDVDDS
jgi:hypothetical protein